MPKMIRWDERQYYSIEFDAHVARVSAWDDRHQEHFTEIITGKGFRDRREEAVMSLIEAIESGHKPGPL